MDIQAVIGFFVSARHENKEALTLDSNAPWSDDGVSTDEFAC